MYNVFYTNFTTIPADIDISPADIVITGAPEQSKLSFYLQGENDQKFTH